MKKIKELLQHKNIKDSVIHILLFCLALWLAYSTYKIWARSFNSLGWPAIKLSIKSSFSYSILINAVIFIYHRFILFKKTEGGLPFKAYISIFITLVFTLNLMAFFMGSFHITYTMNIAILYWALFLPVYNSINVGSISINLDFRNISFSNERIQLIKQTVEESPFIPYIVATIGLGIVYLYLLQAANFN
ncbi:MAG: hypothetical protein HZA78_08685 [Candidatus Schekmanbacteria bacterium]|nr:hypothetical protein [Candidatus Schekmanbacteria bacterium]